MAKRERSALRSDLVREAYLILQDIDPEMGGVLWLHAVVGESKEKIARRLENDPEKIEAKVKKIQRLIEGYTRHGGKRIPGAKEYIEKIMTILTQAERVGLSDEVLRLFNDPYGKRRWGTKFLSHTLTLLTAAVEASCLERILQLLALARKNSPERCYDLLDCMFNLSKRKKLNDFFPALLRVPADDEFLPKCVRLLQDLCYRGKKWTSLLRRSAQ